MSLEQMYYVGELVGVVFIFGSLIFVGMQLRQNTNALNTTVASDYAALWSSSTMMVAGSERLAVDYTAVSTATKADEVSPEALIRVGAFIVTIFKNCEFAYYRHLKGELEVEFWQASRNGALEQLNIPLVLSHIWPTLRNQYTPQFLKFIDDAVDNGEHLRVALLMQPNTDA